MSAPREDIDVSVIIPVGSRHADVVRLYEEYRVGLEALDRPYEYILVLDGRRPDLVPVLRDLASRHHEVRIVTLTRPFGEATAIMAGFEQARGRIIVTLPAYDQIDGAEIPKLVRGLESADLVVGLRWPRAGNWLEKYRRDAFHRLIGSVTGARFNDLGCTARAMKRRVLEEITLYGDQHRFLPILANRQGFTTAEAKVKQSPKDRFEGHYRTRDYAHRFLDIFTVFFLVRFTRKPLRFFGMFGVITFAIGATVTAWLVGERLLLMKPLADRPAFLLSSLFVVLGLQLFALGLLGELMIFTNARDQKDYQVAEIVEFPAAGELSSPSAADSENLELAVDRRPDHTRI